MSRNASPKSRSDAKPSLADLLSPADATALLPTHRGRKLSEKTVRRWMTRGSGGVVLRHLRGPRGMMTTHDWLLEFFEAVDAARRESEETPPPRTRPGRRLLRDAFATK